MSVRHKRVGRGFAGLNALEVWGHTRAPGATFARGAHLIVDKPWRLHDENEEGA